MLSIRSLKTLSKTLEELLSDKDEKQEFDNQTAIDSCVEYVEAHMPIESSESTRLHEELIRLHSSLVAGSSAEHEKLFIDCFIQLFPCLITVENAKYWFSYYVSPALNSSGQSNMVVKAAREFLITALE